MRVIRIRAARHVFTQRLRNRSMLSLVPHFTLDQSPCHSTHSSFLPHAHTPSLVANHFAHPRRVVSLMDTAAARDPPQTVRPRAYASFSN